jgi:adenylate kinase
VNVFLAGVHGVGKSYLGERAAAGAGYVSVSASKLISEERQQVSWTVDKRVTDADANQQALITAVTRRNKAGERLLIDGHFVLFGTDREIIMLDINVFADLNLAHIILVETSAQVAFERSRIRGTSYRTHDEVSRMMQAEQAHAKAVAAALRIDIVVLFSPTERALVTQLCAGDASLT